MPNFYSLLCVIELLMILTTLLFNRIQSKVPICDNDIYCHGSVLETVQNSVLFEDSKTFVDMQMKMSAAEVKKRYWNLMWNTKYKPTKDQVEVFVHECFDTPGRGFEIFDPPDWKDEPKILDAITDPGLKNWAKDLNNFWKYLGRKVKSDVKTHQDRYSLIYVPNAFIVPGGRFREFYYWDSYWIILGLLHSEMFTSVKGMLENFTYIVKNHGLVPNGGRIYYLRRSQPPLLIPMFKLYYDATKDIDFVRRHIELLEKEFNFWIKNRLVNVKVDGKTYRLAYYNSESDGPRPESFREDIHAAKLFKSAKAKNEFYSELKSACESGWDFSSRWFITEKIKGNLTDIKTRSIIPVDLNAMIYWNARILHSFLTILKSNKADLYKNISDEWLESVTKVLWCEEDGTWYDYDRTSGTQRKLFFPSNIAPLWTECYNQSERDSIGKKVVQYLLGSGIKQYKGGIPTSLEESGEQWDFPNAWPPLQHMIISGLELTANKDAKHLAFELATNWIQANYIGYEKTTAMFEKYDCVEIGGYGGGGEYSVQTGFGWTNGVCLDLLAKYGSKLVRRDAPSNAAPNECIKISFSIAFRLTVTILHSVIVW